MEEITHLWKKSGRAVSLFGALVKKIGEENI